MPNKPPTLDEVFRSGKTLSPERQAIADELARLNAAPLPQGFGNWILSKLPASHPAKQAIKRAQLNGTPLTEEQINDLFKQ